MSTNRMYLPTIPVYPDTIEQKTDIPQGEEGTDQPETVTIPHPHAGEIDYEQLQELIGDAIWVGPGSRWQLPWEYGTGPVALTGDLTIHTSDLPAIPANGDDERLPAIDGRADMNRGLTLAIRYALPIYPPLGDIRKALAGHDLADNISLEHPSHADVLLALANGRKYQQ